MLHRLIAALLILAGATLSAPAHAAPLDLQWLKK